MARSSKPTIKELEKRMDKLAQTCSRCKGAWKSNGEWVAKCVTCGKVCPCFGPNCMQGGHFIPRGCRPTRWVDGNIYPQCPRCNGFLNGAYIDYSLWMVNNHFDDYKGLTNMYNEYRRGNPIKLSMNERYALYNSWLHKGRKLEGATGLALFPKAWDYVIIEDKP